MHILILAVHVSLKSASFPLVAVVWLVLAGSAAAQVVITCPGQRAETFEHAWEAPCVETCADGSWVIRTDGELLPCQEANSEHRRRQHDKASTGGIEDSGEGSDGFAEDQRCAEHVVLHSADYWAGEFGRPVSWVLNSHRINLWSKSGATGSKGRKVGEMRVGSHAVIVDSDSSGYQVVSPLDRSIGWVSKVQVSRTLWQDTESRKRCDP